MGVALRDLQVLLISIVMFLALQIVGLAGVQLGSGIGAEIEIEIVIVIEIAIETMRGRRHFEMTRNLDERAVLVVVVEDEREVETGIVRRRDLAAAVRT